MKQFKGNRTIEQIKKSVLALGLSWDQSGYDKGGDWINFGWEDNSGEEYNVLFNAFNGTFMIKHPIAEKFGEQFITERSSEMDGISWYDSLLETIYEPMEERKCHQE